MVTYHSPGSTIIENNKAYYYVETTEPGWGIGNIPQEYQDVAAYIVHLVPMPALTQTWSCYGTTADSTSYNTNVTITVKNEGTVVAREVYVYAGFDAGGGMLWNIQNSDNFTLDMNSETTVTLHLTLSRYEYTRLVVGVVYGGHAVDKSYSGWFTS